MEHASPHSLPWGGAGESPGQPRTPCLEEADKEAGAAAAAEACVSIAPGSRALCRLNEFQAEATEASHSCSFLPKPCKVLVLLNPRGGTGRALHLFRNRVQPMLEEAGVSFTLRLTERRNHARELVRDENLSSWDALVVMSGDGLMHEVVNGLMERPDWETAIQKPLCSLPAGSGNALAASVNHYAGNEQVTNEDLLTNCTQLLCRRGLSPMNLLSLHTASGRRLFSVLSLGWGFVADVDVESEKYRCLGKIRFTLGTFLRLAALRTYHGTLAYLPVGAPSSENSAGPPPGQDQPGPVDSLLVPLGQPVPHNWTVVPHHEFVLVLVLLHSHLGSEMYAAPMARGAAGVMHLFYLRAGVPRATLLRLFLAMEKGTHLDLGCPNLVYVPVVAFRLEPHDPRGVLTVDGEQLVSEAVQGQVHPGGFQLVSGCSELKPGPEPKPLPCSEDSASSEFTS
ncbi:sphingosine kinase 1 [Gracilinanus agilis]|uniref:sphingosine kinase 1 n=1 Tax=Gracilinanus agilis TaxID=191870 RepID=UPI001CFE0824|nr:sphingosine kinase 1 [Gracilinanus agilis]